MIENIVHCVWLPRPKPLISLDLFQLSSACKLNRRRKSNLWDVTGTTFIPRSRSFSSFDFTHKYKENSPVTFNIHLLLVHLALLISSQYMIMYITLSIVRTQTFFVIVLQCIQRENVQNKNRRWARSFVYIIISLEFNIYMFLQ